MESIKSLVWRPLEFLKSLISPSHTPLDKQLAPEPQRAESQTPTPSIDGLNLSPRVYNCLRKADIHNIETVVSMTDENLLNIHGFGVKALDELKERLASHNQSDDNLSPVMHGEG